MERKKRWLSNEETSDDEQLIRSYVLGDLDQSAKEKLEERYFGDDALFNRFEEIEQELIENYHLGRLPAAERRRLEKQLRANPHRRENTQLVGELIRRFAPQTIQAPFPIRRRSPVAALAVALFLTTAGLLVMVAQNANLRRHIPSLSTPSPVSSTTGPDTGPQQSTAMGSEVRLQLDASLISRTRSLAEGAQERIFRLRRDALVVRITLVLQQPDQRELYSVVLVDANGAALASHHQLSPGDGSQVTAIFPAALLRQGSYLVRLNDSRGKTVESFPLSVRVE